MTTMTDTARTAVLRQLAEAHECFAEREQVYVVEGRAPEAEGARQYVRWIRRALDAEMRQDEPIDPRPPCTCIECGRAYAKGMA